MPEMYAEEFMVRASVQILMAKPEYIKPEGFAIVMHVA